MEERTSGSALLLAGRQFFDVCPRGVPLRIRVVTTTPARQLEPLCRVVLEAMSVVPVVSLAVVLRCLDHKCSVRKEFGCVC